MNTGILILHSIHVMKCHSSDFFQAFKNVKTREVGLAGVGEGGGGKCRQL